MAMENHLEVYHSYTSAELAAEIETLKKRKLGFQSQTVGSKSYAQDMRLLNEQLQAAVRVQNERSSAGGGHANAVGVVNFSGY